MPDVLVVDIGIFAHNEADGIAGMLDSLFDQDILTSPAFDCRVHILANGCTDATVACARRTVQAHGVTHLVRIHDLPLGGKSRTWDRFVHDLSRPEADHLVFMDADIRIPHADMLQRLVTFLAKRPQLAGASSRPVKDIVHDPALARGPMDALIGAAGGTLGDWKNAICGQLYILRAGVARSFRMPIGLPVEDGFVRAMVQTRNFTMEGEPEDQLDGCDELFHVYASERGVAALLRHQTRIVLGSAINTVIYDHLRALSPAGRERELERGAIDPGWLPDLLQDRLPRRTHGYVPWHFLTKRTHIWAQAPDRMRPRRVAVMGLGFLFDAVVYVRAQYSMGRGAGSGYW